MVTAAQRNASIPPSFSDGWKRIFLGKPLTSEQLESERLSNPVALGAISPDAISSTAFGPEQVMMELLPRAGMAAFTLLLPRREYSQLLGRLLHDRTADMIAKVVSRIPGASAQIVAYDIATRIASASSAPAEIASPARVQVDPLQLPRTAVDLRG